MTLRIPNTEQWKELISQFSPSKTFYGTCVTEEGVANKVVECPEFGFADMVIGTRICITMVNGQTYDGQVKLNINNTGAQKFYIKQDDENGLDAWEAGQTIDCVFDGLAWCLVGVSGDNNLNEYTLSAPNMNQLLYPVTTENTVVIRGGIVQKSTEEGANVGLSTLPAATTTKAGVMTAADKSKLSNLPTFTSLGTGLSISEDGKLNVTDATEVVQESGDSETAVMSQKAVSDALESLSNDLGDLGTAITGKQDELISGTSIKTINSTSLLGSGNMELQPLLISGTSIKTVNNNSLLGSGNINIPVVSVLGETGDSTTATMSQKAISDELDGITHAVNDAYTAIDSVTSDTAEAQKTADEAKELVEGLQTSKQDTLVSGTSIKTINSTSLLGSGNIELQPLLVSGTSIKTVNNNSLLGSGNINIPIVTVADEAGQSTTNAISQKYVTNQLATLNTSVSGANTNASNAQTTADEAKELAESLQTGKQDALVSGTSIKTINNNSLLGSGNIEVQTPLVSGTSIRRINGFDLLGSGGITINEVQVVQKTGQNDETVMSQKAVTDSLSSKQDMLTSGTNIKTINGNSILGSGDLTIAGGGGGGWEEIPFTASGRVYTLNKKLKNYTLALIVFKILKAGSSLDNLWVQDSQIIMPSLLGGSGELGTAFPSVGTIFLNYHTVFCGMGGLNNVLGSVAYAYDESGTTSTLTYAGAASHTASMINASNQNDPVTSNSWTTESLDAWTAPIQIVGIFGQ